MKNQKNKVPVIKNPEWKRRRLRLDLALLAVLVWISWILWKGTDLALYQQSAIALIAGGVALIGQYVFGAVWDDKNYMNALASLQKPADATDSSEPVDQVPGDTTDNKGNE